jgi:uncharacterized membrane protein
MEPARQPAKTMSPGRTAYEILALSGVAFELGTIIYKWARLPAVIPTHFGFSGQADDWSGKKWLLLLPALTLVLYIGLTWLRRYPQKFNYQRQITKRNADRQYYFAASLVDILKAELMWLFAIITWQAIRVALGQAAGLGIAFLPIVLVVMGATVIIHLYRASQIG